MSIAEILEAEGSIEKRVELILDYSDSDIPVRFLREAIRHLDREKGDHLNAARVLVKANDLSSARSLYMLALQHKWSEDKLKEADMIIEEGRSKNVFTVIEYDRLRNTGRSLCTSIAPQTY